MPTLTTKYNKIYDKVADLCRKCYYNQLCSQCYFLLEEKNGIIVCDKFLSKGQFETLMKKLVAFIENNPKGLVNINRSINSVI